MSLDPTPFLCSIRTIEGVLPTPIEWGPTVFSSGFAHVPEALGYVKAPVLDASGKQLKHKDCLNPSTGQPYAAPALWIGTWMSSVQQPNLNSWWCSYGICASPRVGGGRGGGALAGVSV